jgi:hypothetical protein
VEKMALLNVVGKLFGLIIRLCSFCGRFLGLKSAAGAPGGVSHGMCNPACDKAVEYGYGNE